MANKKTKSHIDLLKAAGKSMRKAQKALEKEGCCPAVGKHIDAALKLSREAEAKTKALRGKK